jgi:uncharacterized protein (DUF433 family)
MRRLISPKQLLEIKDPRMAPAYGIREAAHYLRLPPATLRTWVVGRLYPTRTGVRQFKPIIELPDPELQLLSFVNLAEAHVLGALRRNIGIDLRKIRAALRFVRSRFGWDHPLIRQEFRTDGATIFVEHLGKLIDASERGQLVMQWVREYAQRLDWDDAMAIRLWPFTRNTTRDNPKSVFIDPRISFGRPSLAQCNVPTSEIAGRYLAGDSIVLLARDYGCQREEIEEALRCELGRQLAI